MKSLVDTSVFMWWCFLEKLLRLLGPSFVLDLCLQPVEGDAVSQITTWTNWISLCDFPSIPGCFIKLSSLVSSSILLLVLTHHPPFLLPPTLAFITSLSDNSSHQPGSPSSSQSLHLLHLSIPVMFHLCNRSFFSVFSPGGDSSVCLLGCLPPSFSCGNVGGDLLAHVGAWEWLMCRRSVPCEQSGRQRTFTDGWGLMPVVFIDLQNNPLSL